MSEEVMETIEKVYVIYTIEFDNDDVEKDIFTETFSQLCTMVMSVALYPSERYDDEANLHVSADEHMETTTLVLTIEYPSSVEGHERLRDDMASFQRFSEELNLLGWTGHYSVMKYNASPLTYGY